MDKLLIGFKTNRPFAIYTILTVLLFTTALAAPLIAPYNPIDAKQKIRNKKNITKC